MTARKALVNTGISIAALGLTCAFFINLCDWIYRCGCRSLWSGADAMCNVHQAGVKHCPFCNHGSTGYALVLAAVMVPQMLAAWWPRTRTVVRLAAALLIFPVAIGLAAIALGWWDGYWN